MVGSTMTLYCCDIGVLVGVTVFTHLRDYAYLESCVLVYSRTYEYDIHVTVVHST